ncbi:MAG: hypothetical protein P1U56_19260 [Saprospiraceae bacterium]|nr:hypothetical protein [Saprospiraceae bacterium]
MKYISTIIALFMCFSGFGQSDHFSNRNALKISPVEFGKAQFEVSYEHYFGDRSSSFSISPSVILKENNQESIEGFQIGAQYRFYLSHVRKDERRVFLGFHNIGLYTGLYGQYLDYKEDYQYMWYDNQQGEPMSGEFTKDVTAMEGGAIIGVQIDITNRILLDFFVGGGIRYSDYVDTREAVVNPGDYYNEPGIFDPEYQGVKPKIGFQLGILF